MNTATIRVVLLSSIIFHCDAGRAWSDTFGSGLNSFDIEFVTIGNPGNLPDATGSPSSAGSVAYSYRIGTYEISEQMITKANAEGGLGITMFTRGPNQPANSVTWYEAARFINWLNVSAGSTPAYKFAVQPGESGYNANSGNLLWTVGDAGYDASNLYRNSLAQYFLPSMNEWYKAAYYDPTSGGYFDFPTGSNTAPTPVASGTASDTAVYAQSFETGPADVTLAGGLSPSGTMGQGGNVWEWEETAFNLLNDDGFSSRGIRSGDWDDSSVILASSFRSGVNPAGAGNNFGFRVASVLEPATPGDFNGDGIVDAADYVVWRKKTDSPDDFDEWRANFGNTYGSGAAFFLSRTGARTVGISHRRCSQLATIAISAPSQMSPNFGRLCAAIEFACHGRMSVRRSRARQSNLPPPPAAGILAQSPFLSAVSWPAVGPPIPGASRF